MEERDSVLLSALEEFWEKEFGDQNSFQQQYNNQYNHQCFTYHQNNFQESQYNSKTQHNVFQKEHFLPSNSEEFYNNQNSFINFQTEANNFINHLTEPNPFINQCTKPQEDAPQPILEIAALEPKKNLKTRVAKRSGPTLPCTCPVCQRPASGQCFYGARVCVSCRGFFRRSVQGKKSFSCPRENEGENRYVKIRKNIIEAMKALLNGCRTFLHQLSLLETSQKSHILPRSSRIYFTSVNDAYEILRIFSRPLCVIDSRSRSSCGACRMEKCKKAGMNPRSVGTLFNLKRTIGIGQLGLMGYVYPKESRTMLESYRDS